MLNRIRVALIASGLVAGIALNTTLVPQLMTPRPPVFNGPDIAENWEWRSMAIQTHSWWLWDKFPDATVVNAGFVPPPGNPEALQVGMKFSLWIDEYLGLDVDTTEPALDVSELGIRDELRSYQRVYSRIHCRSGQEMEVRDTCYYFVAWDPALIPSENPVFVAVETSRTLDDEEMALIERNLLEKISPVPIDELLAIDEVVVP